MEFYYPTGVGILTNYLNNKAFTSNSEILTNCVYKLSVTLTFFFCDS